MEQINNNGLESLVWIANHYQKNVTVGQLAHAIGLQSHSPTDWELKQCAHTLGYETQATLLTIHQLANIPLPALICINDNWHILTYQQELKLINPITLESVQWESVNITEITQLNVLLIKEQLEIEQKKKFGFAWFIPSIIRQRFKLKNVFILAAIVQLFALISPLLFQNLIDKVLVGRSLANLHILALGILAIAIAEPIVSHP